MLATLRLLTALTPAQRRLIRTRKVDGNFTPADLIELLRPLAEFDGSNDRARSSGPRVLILLFVLGFGTFALLPADWQSLSTLFMLIAPALLLLALKWLLSMADISNNLRCVALPFLAVLREDMASGAQISVQIDLHNPISRRKRLPRKRAYPQGSYHKVVDTSYRDSWFSGVTRLADGSQLRWTVVDDLLIRKRVRYKRRGNKTKIGEYKRSLLQAVVSLPQSNYRLDAATANDGTQMSVRSSDKWTTVKLSRKLKSRSSDPMDVRELIDLIATAFRRVIPAPQEVHA
jgi:hypothetical protein